MNFSKVYLSSSTVSKFRAYRSRFFNVRMKRAATPFPSGARTKLALDCMPRNPISCWEWSLTY